MGSPWNRITSSELKYSPSFRQPFPCKWPYSCQQPSHSITLRQQNPFCPAVVLCACTWAAKHGWRKSPLCWSVWFKSDLQILNRPLLPSSTTLHDKSFSFQVADFSASLHTDEEIVVWGWVLSRFSSPRSADLLHLYPHSSSYCNGRSVLACGYTLCWTFQSPQVLKKCNFPIIYSLAFYQFLLCTGSHPCAYKRLNVAVLKNKYIS